MKQESDDIIPVSREMFEEAVMEIVGKGTSSHRIGFA